MIFVPGAGACNKSLRQLRRDAFAAQILYKTIVFSQCRLPTVDLILLYDNKDAHRVLIQYAKGILYNERIGTEIVQLNFCTFICELTGIDILNDNDGMLPFVCLIGRWPQQDKMQRQTQIRSLYD